MAQRVFSGRAMSAAAFVLAINLFIAGIFATAFGVVAAYARSAIGARWLAVAYGLGMVNPVLEFMLPGQADPRPVQVAIFAVFLFALTLFWLLRPSPWRWLAFLWPAAMLFVVTATANHWWLDAAGGAACVLLALAIAAPLARSLPKPWERRA